VVGGTGAVCCSYWGMVDGAGRLEEVAAAAVACGLAKDPGYKTWAY